MKPLRIIVIGRGFPEEENLNLGNVELDQAKALAKRGHSLLYFAAECITPPKRFAFLHRKEDGVVMVGFRQRKIITVRMRKLSYFSKFLFFTLLYLYLCATFRRPDIIHLHFPTLYPCRMFRLPLLCGSRLVCTEHWTEIQKKTVHPVFIERLKGYVRTAAGFTCPGEKLKESVAELTGTKRTIDVVYNMTDPCFTSQPHKQKEGCCFIAAGRLVEVKRFDLMMEAFAEALPGERDVILQICGEGPEMEYLKERRKQLHLEERVILTGNLRREELANLMRESDALVSCSSVETFCLPVAEAWMCGIPVIANEQTILREHTGVAALGILTDSNDRASLVSAFRGMRERIRQEKNSGQNQRKEIRSYAESYFSEDAVMRQMEAIYRNSTVTPV